MDGSLEREGLTFEVKAEVAALVGTVRSRP
jgi:hypothetical protein